MKKMSFSMKDMFLLLKINKLKSELRVQIYLQKL